jgi:hypothetical protein
MVWVNNSLTKLKKLVFLRKKNRIIKLYIFYVIINELYIHSNNIL